MIKVIVHCAHQHTAVTSSVYVSVKSGLVSDHYIAYWVIRALLENLVCWNAAKIHFFFPSGCSTIPHRNTSAGFIGSTPKPFANTLFGQSTYSVLVGIQQFNCFICRQLTDYLQNICDILQTNIHILRIVVFELLSHSQLYKYSLSTGQLNQLNCGISTNKLLKC